MIHMHHAHIGFPPAIENRGGPLTCAALVGGEPGQSGNRLSHRLGMHSKDRQEHREKRSFQDKKFHPLVLVLQR